MNILTHYIYNKVYGQRCKAAVLALGLALFAWSPASAQIVMDDEEEEEETSPPPAGGGKKRKAAPTGEAEGSKKGKTLPPDYSTNADDGEEEWPPRPKPLATS